MNLLVSVAASVYLFARKVTPGLLELAGAVCLVVAGSKVAPWCAWTVAGMALLAKSYEADIRQAARKTETPS